MRTYVLIPTLKTYGGGLAKLVDYARHLSTEYETYLVVLDEGSIDKRYS